jgi:hypothetical protein
VEIDDATREKLEISRRRFRRRRHRRRLCRRRP